MPPGITGSPSPSEVPVALHSVKMQMGKVPSGHSEMARVPGDKKSSSTQRKQAIIINV